MIDDDKRVAKRITSKYELCISECVEIPALAFSHVRMDSRSNNVSLI